MVTEADNLTTDTLLDEGGASTPLEDTLVESPPSTETAPESLQETVTEGAPPAESEAPTETQTPSPTASDYAPQPDLIRQQLADAQRQNTEFRLREQHQAISQAAAEREAQLVNQGFDPEQARASADEFRRGREEVVSLHQNYQTEIRNMEGKYLAAMYYGGLHKVHPSTLFSYDSPQAMEEAAKKDVELNGLRARIKSLEEGRVPDQKLDPGSSKSGSSDDFFMEQFGNGTVNDTKRALEIQAKRGY